MPNPQQSDRALLPDPPETWDEWDCTTRSNVAITGDILHITKKREVFYEW